MAKDVCVFCGQVPGFLKEQSIIVGKTTQVCCATCAKEMDKKGELELCSIALQRGYAKNPEKIKARMELILRAENARPKCLRCGAPMVFGKKLTLDNSPMIRDGIFSSICEMIPSQCTRCFKLEFYSPAILKSNELLTLLYTKDT